jgi:hypothetical protein
MRLTTPAIVALATLGGSAAILPAAVHASDFGYTYAEFRYLDINADNNGGDAEGGTAIGWYRLNERFFALGQLTKLDRDSGVDATTFAAGGGYILSLNDHWDVVGIATLRRAELDTGPRTLSDNGYGVQLGIRGMPIPRIETRAFVNYVDISKGDTSFFLSGDYSFTPTLAGGIAAEFGGDADTFSVGFRYAFGN